MFDFNFYNGTVIGMNSNSEEQLRFIKSVLPVQVQSGFQSRSINFYDPGNGDFYYVKTLSDGRDLIAQTARSCNCYMSGADGAVHRLSVSEVDNFDHSIFNDNAHLPPASRYTVVAGDTLSQIAKRYGIDLNTLAVANRNIGNVDHIEPGQMIMVPAQSYSVSAGDSLYAIAHRFGVTFPAILDLNSHLADPNLIFPGQTLKVPTGKLSDPFAYDVQPSDTLSNIAAKYGVTLSSVTGMNPQIKNTDLIYPNDIVNMPIYLPSQGLVDFSEINPGSGDGQTTTLTGAKFAQAQASKTTSKLSKLRYLVKVR
jgi:LysM repeat protein